jgi:putative membrane protein insertion efficiency factor
MKRLLSDTLILAIKAYRATLSPWIGQGCRFTPSCSVYAQEAIGRHGVAGAVLAAKRLARCNPWGASGYDPVPDRRQTKACGHVHTG